MDAKKFEKVIDKIQNFMIWCLICVTAICILSLILFDVLIGTGVMYSLVRGNLSVAVFISLATSGLLLSLMVIFTSTTQKGSSIGVGWVVAVVVLLISALDVYFDSLTADYLRYGQIISISTLNQADADVHILFRILIGGISTVGEGLAVAIILGMPILKKIISNALSINEKQKPTIQRPPNISGADFRRKPTSSSTFRGIPKKGN